MIKYVLSVILIALPYILYKFFTRNFDYWKKRNVVHPPPVPFFGNFADFVLQRSNIGFVSCELYEQFPDEKYVGAFLNTRPVVIVRDPELIKHVMTKDFYYFHERGMFADDLKKEPLARNLFMSDGDEWRVMRQNLTPLFTSAKMKNMFHLMTQCGDEFGKYIRTRQSETIELEMRDLFSRFSMDVIGSCAFGLQMHSMDAEDTQFRKVGKKLFVASFKRTLKILFKISMPWLSRLLGIQTQDESVNDFFLDMSRKTIATREGRPPERHDFVDLLADLKKEGRIKGDGIEGMKPGGEREIVSLDIDDRFLASQSFIFFTAGFETSSSTISYTLHELALNPDIQKRAQEEIDKLLSKHGGKITYELIKEAAYLEKCVSEAMRKYPVLSMISRTCVDQYTLPDGQVLDKGLMVHIPVRGLHYDPKYYPDPEKYDPERFSPQAIQKRQQYTYMPFGEGQRICIGLRFGKLQVMVGLITLLRSFSVVPCDRTETSIRYEARSFITMPKNGIWLRLEPRSTDL